MLFVGIHDVFGDEMTLACKLGADVAQQAEVLLTAAAYQALDTTEWQCEELHLTVSGMELLSYRLSWRGLPRAQSSMTATTI